MGRVMTVAERKKGNRVGTATCRLIGTERPVAIDPAYAKLGDFDLITRSKAGDAKAGETLVLRHYPLVLTVARKLSRANTKAQHEAMAEMLVSDGVAKMLQIMHRWEPKLGSLTTYLHFSLRRELLRIGCELRGVISVKQAAYMPGRREKMAHLVEQARRVVRVEASPSGVSTWGTRTLRRPSDRLAMGEAEASAGLLSLKGERLAIVRGVLEQMRRQGGQAALCAQVLELRCRGATLEAVGEIVGLSRGRVNQLEGLAVEMVCVAMGRPLPWSKELGYFIRSNTERMDRKAGARLRSLRQRKGGTRAA